MPHVTDSVEFRVESGDALTCNVQPLLHEIRHALARLLECGEHTIIDLRSIPLAPGEELKIIDTLGNGEVQCEAVCAGSQRDQ